MDLSELERLEARTNERKLSDLIREGARLRPQGFGCPSLRDGHGTTCALQAGYEALTGRITEWPCMDIRSATGIPAHLLTEVWQRNDVRKHTREEIADWLESKGY